MNKHIPREHIPNKDVSEQVIDQHYFDPKLFFCVGRQYCYIQITKHDNIIIQLLNQARQAKAQIGINRQDIHWKCHFF
uniref:Putative ovule protein n=1 Tax=Solanum chacoense TaxID=4108 RepID=A0A0V0GYH2_SOLCH